EVLEEALSQYPGAVVVVTHDRSLMARLATRILAVQDGRVTLYPGGYDDYEAARVAAANGAPASVTPASAAPAPKSEAAAPKPSSSKADAAAAKKEERRAQADARKRKQETERIEREIESRETELRALETELAEPGVYATRERSKDLLG